MLAVSNLVWLQIASEIKSLKIIILRNLHRRKLPLTKQSMELNNFSRKSWSQNKTQAWSLIAQVSRQINYFLAEANLAKKMTMIVWFQSMLPIDSSWKRTSNLSGKRPTQLAVFARWTSNSKRKDARLNHSMHMARFLLNTGRFARCSYS